MSLDAEAIHQRRWWALGVLCFSLLVIGLDNTILNVALPHLQDSLGATNSQLQWIVDGYTIVYAGLLLTTGALGDKFGRKGALSLGLVVFGVFSAISAFATSAPMLIATRSLMGIGGALIMPATLSLVTNVFTEPRERARAIGIWAGVAGAGVAVGPIVGGFLMSKFWWGSVFLVNVPVVILALIGGRLFLPTSKDPTAPRLDPVGAVLSTAGLVSLLWGLIEAPSKGWGSHSIMTAFILGFVILALFIAWELHSDHPMLEIRFFKNRRFSAANIAVTFVFFAMFGSGFLITQLLQNVLGYSALRAGFAMMPIAVPLMVLGPVSARLTERFGTKVMVAFGLGLVGTGLAWLSRIGLGDGYLQVFFPVLTLAIGMGLTMAPATESIMGSLPRNKAGVGSAMNDTTRQVGGALGVAVIGSVLASRYRPNVTSALANSPLAQAAKVSGPTGDSARQALAALHDQVGAAKPLIDSAAQHGSPFPKAQADQILHAAHTAFLNGFGAALLVGAAVAFVGALVALMFLPAHATDPELEATPARGGDDVSVLAELDDGERVAVESLPTTAISTEAGTLVAEAIDDDRVPTGARAGAATKG